MQKVKLFIGIVALITSLVVSPVLAVNSNFTQVINAGVLSVGIVDALYDTVVSPAVAFSPVTFSVACQNSTGTLGTASQRIYVENPDAADNGWTVSIAGSAPTATWSGTHSYDFNDPTGTGCTDGADTDSRPGQMTVNPAGATLATGVCGSCTTTGVSLGSSSAFSEGVTNSVTLLNAAAGSDDVADYTLQGVAITQTIPAEQQAAADYAITMVVSVIAI